MVEIDTESEARHLVAVLLRDLSNMEVVRAMDRLIVLPSSKPELERTMQDLALVKRFVVEACPENLKGVATDMFMEHVELVKSNLANAAEGTQA